jgi:hypothetical protein
MAAATGLPDASVPAPRMLTRTSTGLWAGMRRCRSAAAAGPSRPPYYWDRSKALRAVGLAE